MSIPLFFAGGGTGTTLVFQYPVTCVPISGPPPDYLWVARGQTLALQRAFRQAGGATVNLTAARIVFVVKRYDSDPDSIAIATLDNQLLGGITVTKAPYGHAQILMPGSVTEPFVNQMEFWFYEIRLYDVLGNAWLAERGRLFVDARLPVIPP